MSKEEIETKLKQIKKLEDNINEYKDAFDIFDKDKTGFISTKDIIKIKKIFSYPIGQETIENMISEIDSTGEGKFDFKKFLILMKKQIQYIEEKEKNEVLESCREEYLGSKRKRDYLINNESIKPKEKIQNINSDRTINNEKEEIIDNIPNDLSSIKDMNSKSNKKIIHDKIGINQQSIKEINKITSKHTKKVIANESEMIIFNNSKSKKSKKLSKKKSKTNSRKRAVLKETNVLINNNIIPKEMFDKIGLEKKNNFPSLKIENAINYNISKIPIKENVMPLEKLITSFSSKCMSEIDLNNLNNMNSGENSFRSERSKDIFKRPSLFPYCMNSRLDRAPLVNIVKRKKDKITNSSKKLLKGIRDKLMQKGIKFNENNNENKENSTFILQEKLQKIVNNNFYSPEGNITKKDNNILKEEQKLYENNKSRDESTPINLSDDENVRMDEDNNNYENIPEIEDKNLKENPIILYNFELEYKKNEKEENIIQKAIEVPYLIIVEKNILNLEEIKNVLSKRENSSKKLLKINLFDSKNIIENNINKIDSNYLCNLKEKEDSKNELINNEEESIINISKRNENEKVNKYETQKKNISNNNYENFEKNTNISKFLYSDGNHFKINTKFFESNLQDKSFIDDNNITKERKNIKNVKCIKNENYESLNSSDLLGELSYLYLKENQ